MGLFDKIRSKASKAVDQHGDKIDRGLDRAASEANRRTGGKHADKIAKGRRQAKEGMDKLGPDQSGTGRPGGDQPRPDQPGTDQPRPDQPGTDRPDAPPEDPPRQP